MDIVGWRLKIDELDRQLVALISERARCAVEIGKLKQHSNLPVYEPDRERIIFVAGAVTADLRTVGGCDASDPER